jgi:hypothetical protein
MLHRAVVETLETRRLLSFAAPVSYAAGTAAAAMVATGDFNGDGRSDVATANPSSNNVSVLLSNANGTLQAAQQFPAGTNPRSIAVGDVNNDGKVDLVTVNTGGGGNISVLLGNGNGTFQAPTTVTLPAQAPPPGATSTTPVAQAPVSVAVGDLNADGKLDLAVNGQISFYIPYYSPYGGRFDWPQTNNRVNVLLGNGNGTFGNATVYPPEHLSFSIDARDFTGDGKLDVLTAGWGTAFVWPGNGNGTLQPAVTSGGSASGLPTIGDFDGDAKLDLVFGAGSGVTFLKGQGNGAFQSAGFTATVGQIRSVVAGDVNGDGKLDLIASTAKTTYDAYGYYGNYGPTTTEYTKVLLGKGDGTFTRGVSSIVGSYPDAARLPNASALGDFNGDSRPDLVATDPRTGKIYVQLNEVGWIVPGALSISDAAPVTEGNAGTVNAVFTVTLDEAPAANVTVKYDVVDEGATLAGGDFVANSGTLTFTPGQTSKTINVQVRGDRVGEFEEGFLVRLADATNADIVDRDGRGVIIDDEPHIVSFTGGTVTEGNSGTVPLTFTVTLSAASDAPVTVTYGTADYTAVSATDYTPVTGTVTFAPGQTTQTFTIPVKGDLVPENEEYVYGVITGGTNVLIPNALHALGTIKDTDPDPTVSIANVTRAEGNPGTETSFEFVLSLSGPSEKGVTVPFTTAGGSATSGRSNKDFYADSSYAFFPAGHMFATVSVRVIGDSRSESDETFFVNLSNASGATIADGQAVGTILNDESRGKTWIGPEAGGNWSTASNWSPSGVPTATSLVHIAGASVTVDASVTVSELNLDNAATLTVAPNGSRVLRTAGLFVDYYYWSVLNLNDNDMIVDYTAGAGTISPLGAWNGTGYFGIAGMVSFGKLYDGTGILSTRPDALAGRTTLGIGEASRVLGLTGAQTALFSGQTVDATTVLVKYTYAGDANLDGAIDAGDYGAIDNFVQTPAARGYFNGDFNHDGFIDAGDYGIIDNNVQGQGARL